MIRPYLQSDFEAVLGMVRKADRMPVSDIKERLNGWTSLVWEDSGEVRGAVCYQKEEDGEFNIRVFVDPDSRRLGGGSELLKASLAGVKAMNEPGRITVRYRLDQGESQRFFRNRGFAYWYSMDYLAYDGPAMPEPDLPPGVEILPYEDRYYSDYVGVMADAFIPQRRFFDFRPHDVRELHAADGDRERLLSNRDNMLILLDHGRLAGLAELDGSFIDTLAVDSGTWRQGYGKALMRRSVNLLRDRGHEVIETSVVLGNIRAWRLYNTLGFRRVQTDEWACLWI